MSSSEPIPRLDRDEVISAIRSLSQANWARLKAVSNLYSRPGVEADDLIQKAFLSALDTRTCPTNVDIVRFLAEAMRSIANGEGEKAARRNSISSVARSGNILDQVTNFPDPNPSAEEKLTQQQDVESIRLAIIGLFTDDPAARDIVEGKMAELTPDELRELTGLDRTAYDSKLRLIRRRIIKHYPKGWTP